MRRWTALALLCWVLAACGGGGGGSIPIGDLEVRFQRAFCAEGVHCGSFPNQASCLASVFVDFGQWKAGIQSRRIIYDGAAAAACLDMLATQDCAQSTVEPSNPDACVRTFQGTLAEGAPCFLSVECVSANCDRGKCDPAATCCQGTCGPPDIPIPQGGACGVGGHCAADTYCKSGATGGLTCQPAIAVGQPCSAIDVCALGSICHLAAGNGTGVCGNSYPKRGEDCDLAILPCDEDTDTCDATTKKCVVRAAVGAACQSTTDCVLYAKCDPATRKCVASSLAGGLCADKSDCLGSLSCTAGICEKPAPEPICS
jgi:Dickkopf N-terminal cysteine-rich region